MSNKTVKYELATHKGKEVIFIRFDYDAALIARVKKLVGVQWSQSQKAWYGLDTPQYRNRFGLQIDLVGKEVLSHIPSVNQPALNRLIETLQLKGYSPSTLKTYRNEFAQLLYVIKDKNVNDLDSERLRSYFLYCITTLKLSENTLHSRINAVKFYFEQVLKRDKFFFDIPRPKKPLILPLKPYIKVIRPRIHRITRITRIYVLTILTNFTNKLPFRAILVLFALILSTSKLV